MDLFTLEPMKYQAFPATMSTTDRRRKLQQMINSGEYYYSEKTDGNLCRAIITKDRFALQTRGISKETGTYGEIQDKVFWADSIRSAFNDTTVLLGEAYIENGTDKTVGAVLRCLPNKAKQRQIDANEFVRFRIFDVLYYNGINLLNTPFEERKEYLNNIHIDNELINVVESYKMNEDFFDNIQTIFDRGGEGVVCYHKSMIPVEGRTSVGETLKVKQEIQDDIDCFILNKNKPEMDYTGKELNNWKYWQDETPVTRNWYYDWPGSISVGVYKNNEIYHLCDISNLTDELREDMKNNWDKYYMHPCKIKGMMLSTNSKNDQISIRHPKLISLRDDIDIKDCTLEKIMG